MSAVPPLLDDDGYTEGRAGNPGNSRRSVTEACGRLEAVIGAKPEASVHAMVVVN